MNHVNEAKFSVWCIGKPMIITRKGISYRNIVVIVKSNSVIEQYFNKTIAIDNLNALSYPSDYKGLGIQGVYQIHIPDLYSNGIAIIEERSQR